MAVSIKDVLALDLAGDFDAVKRTKIQPFIDKAACFVDAATWGDKADTAIANLAAHFLYEAIQGGSGASGPVISESAGMLSHTFAAPASPAVSGAAGASFGSTHFGRCYLELRSTLALTPLTAWGLDCA